MGLKSAVSIAEKNANRIAEVIGNRQIRHAIAVEILRGDIHSIRTRGITDKGLERAIAIAKKNVHTIGTVKTLAGAHREVKIAVTIQVFHRDVERSASSSISLLRPKCAVTLAQQHANLADAGIRRYDVGIAIAIEIAHSDGINSLHGVEILVRREGPVAQTQKHADVIRVNVGRGEIKLSIVVEIRNGD